MVSIVDIRLGKQSHMQLVFLLAAVLIHLIVFLSNLQCWLSQCVQFVCQMMINTNFHLVLWSLFGSCGGIFGLDDPFEELFV